MGKELDDKEREEREKLCLNKSDGKVIEQDEYGGRVKCHFVERTRDEGVSGLSGSKVRLLAANGDYGRLYEVYDGYLTRPQVDELVQMILAGLNLSPDAEPSVTANASVTAASSRKRPASASVRGNQTKKARRAGGRRRVHRNTRVRRQRRTRKQLYA